MTGRSDVLVIHSVSPQESVEHWIQVRWTESRASTTTALHQFVPTPSTSAADGDLSRRAWTRLTVYGLALGGSAPPCYTGVWPKVGSFKRQTTSSAEAALSTTYPGACEDSWSWTQLHANGSRRIRYLTQDDGIRKQKKQRVKL